MESRLSDGYMATALQMFEACGMDSSGELPVDTIMDNFAPYVPSDKGEYSELRCLLDPERCNRSIRTAELAAALERYSERQHTRGDFDDSINLKNGHTPLDSDSGISTDMGYQLLEELQGELRDKCQALRRLQRQLEAMERQHEEALAGVAAECASLRAQLQLMREENSALASVRRECEEASERLVVAEASAEERGRQLDAARRKLTALQRSLDNLESEKATLQNLLAKSKEECHRINDMYAARQAALLEEKESFRSDYADLYTRFQEQEECLQQTLKEKVLLEMEVSDVLNRSRQADVLRALDRSVEVSYTEAQLLRTLDTMHSLDGDPEENISQDEFYISDAKVERGRPSLFDELINVNSFQRKSLELCDRCEKHSCDDATTQTDSIEKTNNNNSSALACDDCVSNTTVDTWCSRCVAKNTRIAELESKVDGSEKTIRDMRIDLTLYESNLTVLQSNFECGEEKNRRNQSLIELLRKKLDALDSAFKMQAEIIEKKRSGACCVGTQTVCDTVATVATQASASCGDCDARAAAASARTIRTYVWELARGSLQLVAVLCLAAALLALYNVSHYSYASRRCVRAPQLVPWRWLALDDLVNFLFRIEYIGEVPM